MEKTRRITVKTHTPLTQPCPYQIHSGSDGQPDLRTGAAEGLQASTVFRSTRFLGQQDSKSPSGTSGTNPLKMKISESLRDGPLTQSHSAAGTRAGTTLPRLSAWHPDEVNLRVSASEHGALSRTTWC